jgi:hypothetical protein
VATLVIQLYVLFLALCVSPATLHHYRAFIFVNTVNVGLAAK